MSRLLPRVLFILIGFFIVGTFPARAFEDPHLYYDWNRYYEPSSQVLGVRAFAQESTDSATLPPQPPPTTAADHHTYKQYDGYFLGFTNNLNPDNGLYFLKRLQENLAVTFTFDAKAKEALRLQIAGERLGEMETMAQEGKINYIASLASTYDNTMDSIAANLTRLKSQNQDVASLLASVDLEGAKHTLVLEEVSLRVPPQAAQGVGTALASSEKAVDTVADLAGRPALPQEMVNRLQSLKAQGLLTEEEVAKLVGVKSRVEAREELRKFADSNVLPSADFKKLDETARFYFPQGYASVVEMRKFGELKALETQKPDEQTLSKVQEFADKYKPGDIVPSELRRWWVPLVRLEELQNTMRPDLIKEDLFRNRPEDQQKYREFVERVKPRAEDIDYVSRLVERDPSVLNDPAYARIKALADKFGSAETDRVTPGPTQSCARDSHWVFVPFMPNGGYCVPNLVYAVAEGTTGGGAGTSPCPPGYHRNDPQGACYPDNQYGPGIGPRVGGPIGAPGTCSSGYHWEPLPQTGGYCAPDFPTIGGGPYPNPITPPSYCPSGQVFRDGKCVAYNPPPAEGCPSGQWWNGQSCIAQKDCGVGYYQDSNGECKQASNTFEDCQRRAAECVLPNTVWDSTSCTCRSTFTIGNIEGRVEACKKTPPTCPGDQYVDFTTCSCFPLPPNHTLCTKSPTECTANGGYLDQLSCSCKTASYATPPPYGTPTGDTQQRCGPGYYWNGSYCVLSGGGTYSTPSGPAPYASPPPGGYGTPATSCPAGQHLGTGGYCVSDSSYGTPSGSYPTPYYGTPSGTYTTPPPYSTPTGTYGTPSYSTPPPYGTPTETYGTPSYSTPPPYGTPEYSTPPPYGTPEYSTPPPYGTPEYSTPPPYGTPEYSTPPPYSTPPQ